MRHNANIISICYINTILKKVLNQQILVLKAKITMALTFLNFKQRNKAFKVFLLGDDKNKYKEKNTWP